MALQFDCLPFGRRNRISTLAQKTSVEGRCSSAQVPGGGMQLGPSNYAMQKNAKNAKKMQKYASCMKIQGLLLINCMQLPWKAFMRDLCKQKHNRNSVYAKCSLNTSNKICKFHENMQVLLLMNCMQLPWQAFMRDILSPSTCIMQVLQSIPLALCNFLCQKLLHRGKYACT